MRVSWLRSLPLSIEFKATTAGGSFFTVTSQPMVERRGCGFCGGGAASRRALSNFWQENQQTPTVQHQLDRGPLVDGALERSIWPQAESTSLLAHHEVFRAGLDFVASLDIV